MIHAEFDQTTQALAICGHAGSAPRGEDLICAGVTVLAEALAQVLEQMDLEGKLEEKTIDLGEGAAFFRASGNPECTMAVQGAFATTVAGLAWLAENYPEFVQIKIQ